MKITLLAIAAFLFCSCDSMQEKPSDGAIRNMQDKLRYFHDSRSGECFAAVGQITSSPHATVQVTWVPCTPKIIEIIGSRTDESK